MAQELYNQKDADYFAEVAQPLMLEMTNEAEYNQMKMMLAELSPNKKAEAGSKAASKRAAAKDAEKGTAKGGAVISAP